VGKVTYIMAFMTLWTLSCTQASVLEEKRESFVKISKETTFTPCKKRKKKKEKCELEPLLILGATGSGSVVATNSLGSFILTAEHVCEDVAEDHRFIDTLSKQFLNKKKRFKIHTKYRATSFEGRVVPLDIIGTDVDLDVCIVFAEGLHAKPLKRYYGELSVGEEYYNIAAPMGLFEPGMVPILEGRYLGQLSPYRVAYSIPAIGGSSGSPVIDDKGRLVGMIHSILPRFGHISYGPTLNRLNEFIDSTIEDYHDKWYKNLLHLTRPKQLLRGESG